MHPNITVCCLSLLLLNVVGAKPISDLQSLKQLLEDEISTAPFFASEKMETETEDVDTDKSVFQVPEPQQTWNSSSDLNNSVLLSAKGNALARLFKDLMRTSKRSWSRYKKGGLRSCFGVRLERIGSFSGLGC